MNIFPLFESKREAFDIWKKTVNWWPDDMIVLTFVETESKYWFILYCKSPVLERNLGFVKSVPMSQNYQKFKQGVEKIAILRFGIYRAKKSKAQRENSEYDLELLKKTKMVYNIYFQHYEDLLPNSIEYDGVRNSEVHV